MKRWLALITLLAFLAPSFNASAQVPPPESTDAATIAIADGILVQNQLFWETELVDLRAIYGLIESPIGRMYVDGQNKPINSSCTGINDSTITEHTYCASDAWASTDGSTNGSGVLYISLDFLKSIRAKHGEVGLRLELSRLYSFVIADRIATATGHEMPRNKEPLLACMYGITLVDSGMNVDTATSMAVQLWSIDPFSRTYSAIQHSMGGAVYGAIYDMSGCINTYWSGF